MGKPSMSKITDALISSRLQSIAKAVDRTIENQVGEKCGFILLVWGPHETSFISTDPDRAQSVAAMKEIIAKWEAGQPTTPAHKRN